MKNIPLHFCIYKKKTRVKIKTHRNFDQLTYLYERLRRRRNETEPSIKYQTLFPACQNGVFPQSKRRPVKISFRGRRKFSNLNGVGRAVIKSSSVHVTGHAKGEPLSAGRRQMHIEGFEPMKPICYLQRLYAFVELEYEISRELLSLRSTAAI